VKQYAPHSYATLPLASGQPQRTSPDAGGRKHADCGNNGSDQAGRRLPQLLNASTLYERLIEARGIVAARAGGPDAGP